MIAVSEMQVHDMSQTRRSDFERGLWDWLEAEGPHWSDRTEEDRKALVSRATQIALDHDRSSERYIAQMAQALDLANDWRAFVETDDLIAGRVFPQINPQSFAYQLPRRACAFALATPEPSNGG